MAKHKRWYEQFFDGLYAEVLAAQFEQARTLKQARMIKRLLRLRKGQSVLDIPSGLGRISLPLARAALTVTGVDLTASSPLRPATTNRHPLFP